MQSLLVLLFIIATLFLLQSSSLVCSQSANITTTTIAAPTTAAPSTVMSTTTPTTSAPSITNTPSPSGNGRNASCIFQFHFRCDNEGEWDTWNASEGGNGPHLSKVLLTDQYPDLTTWMNFQFCSVIFNVTRDPDYVGSLNTDPSVGCAYMLSVFNDTTTVGGSYFSQFNATEVFANEAFRPSNVPHWMRHPTKQPVVLYIALGAVSAVLIVVQVAYGVYHSYVNRGTLESVGTD